MADTITPDQSAACASTFLVDAGESSGDGVRDYQLWLLGRQVCRDGRDNITAGMSGQQVEDAARAEIASSTMPAADPARFLSAAYADLCPDVGAVTGQ